MKVFIALLSQTDEGTDVLGARKTLEDAITLFPTEVRGEVQKIFPIPEEWKTMRSQLRWECTYGEWTGGIIEEHELK